MTTQNRFNHDETLRLTRETIERAMNFFNEVNRTFTTIIPVNVQTENHQHLIEEGRRQLEEIIRRREEFETRHREQINHLQTVFTNYLQHLGQIQRPVTVDRQQPLPIPTLDVEAFQRINRDFINGTLDFVRDTHENVLRTFVPTTPTGQVIDTMQRTRDSFLRRQRELTERVTDFVKVINQQITRPITGETQTETINRPTTQQTIEQLIDPVEITRIHQELVGHTLHLVTDLNQRLITLIDQPEHPTITREQIETFNRIGEDFVQHHRELVTRLDGITRQIVAIQTTTLQHGHPNTLPIDELVKVNHETLNLTVRFITNLHENVLKLVTTRTEQVPQLVTATIEHLTRQVEEHHRAHHVLVGRIETLVREMIERQQQLLRQTTEKVINGTGHPTRRQTGNETRHTTTNETQHHTTNRKTTEHRPQKKNRKH